MNERRLGRALAAIGCCAFALGLVARAAYLDRPADWRSLNGWREADYAQMARAFYREDGNPLHPRVDWRGDTSGLVQSELPVLPWMASVLYRAIGPQERVLHWLSAIFSLGALVAFRRLARESLPARASDFATAAFAANGMLVYLATAIQPEAVVLFAEIGGALALWRWWQSGTSRPPYAAAAWTALAVLAKASAVFMAVPIAWFVLRRLGRTALRLPSYWGAAAVTALPPLCWYLWSYRIYQDTGLSLGISNETHWISLPVILHPFAPIVGNLETELRDVFSWCGVILAVCSLRAPFSRLEFPAVWYGAAVAFYVVAADTSGEGWAWYYHVLSLPAGCLLMGLGLDRLASANSAWSRRAALALALATISFGGYRSFELIRERDGQPRLEERYRCYGELASLVPAGARILVRGGRSTDWHGHPVAFNSSEAFHWMDRKGWNYASDMFSLEAIDAFAAAGARYWVAMPDDFLDPALRKEANQRYLGVGACAGYTLFDLGTRPKLGGLATGPPRVGLVAGAR